MTSKKMEPTATSSRWWIGVAVAALALAVFLVQRNSEEESPDSPAISGVADAAAKRSASVTNGAEPPRVTRSSVDRTEDEDEEMEDDSDAPVYPRIEEVLANESISENQAAEALLLVVQNRELSVEERDEALAHGLNLNYQVFASLATDSSLPVVMAERMIDELANLNEMPLQQIEGYLGFVNYRDEEIRTQAAEDLAFILEDEDLAESPEDLRRVALEHIEALKNAPPKNEASADGIGENGATTE